MAFGNYTNKYGLSKAQKETKKEQTHNHNLERFVGTNPQTPQPSEPLERQAKERLTASEYYKAIFSQNSFFGKNFSNLSISDLKYVFDEKAVNKYVRFYGNDISKAKEFETIKDQIPHRLIGGEEILPYDGVDLKKTYNSEAKALAVA